ncbi:ABC transporter substrate-binding protein, partial [Candidatus Auribacterota bacterium]
ETLPRQRKLLSQLIDRFEEENPGIKVKVQISPSGFKKLHAQFAAGAAPDVFYYVSDRLFGLVYKNRLLDLKPFIGSDGEVDLKEYFPQTVQACELDGGIYLMPFHFSTDILFYNKDLFDKYDEPYPAPEWTWTDFKRVASKLTKNESGITREYGTLQPRPVLVMRSFGGTFFDEEHSRPTSDSSENREALKYIKSLRDNGLVPSQAQIRDIEVMDGVTLFSTGKIAMLVGRTYMMTEFNGIKSFDWDITYVPKGKMRFSRLAVGGNCISAATKHPEESWELVKFLSGEEAMQIAAGFRNCVPAIESVARSDTFLHSPPANVNILVDSITDAQMENPKMAHWFEYVDKVIQKDVERVIYGQISVDDAVKDLVRCGKSILAKERDAKKNR